jgi:hypothetical protein
MRDYTMGEPEQTCREGYLVEVLLAILRATDDPEQPGETQRLADVSQIATHALLEMGYTGQGKT